MVFILVRQQLRTFCKELAIFHILPTMDIIINVPRKSHCQKIFVVALGYDFYSEFTVRAIPRARARRSHLQLC